MAAIAAAAAVLVTMAGCSDKTDSPGAQQVPPTQYNEDGSISQVTAGGLPITDGPSGQREGSENATLKVDNPATDKSGKEMDQLAVNALQDVYDYWNETLPANFDGKKFGQPRRLLSYDSKGAAQKFCGATVKEPNAFYCGPPEDGVAWDRSQLLPLINQQTGPMGVVTVFAHEIGHSVQYQLGERTRESIVLEQQADCYAGGYMRWVAEGKSKHFQLSTGEGLNDVLATVFAVRDPAGYVNAGDDTLQVRPHGLAFDRVYAFQAGFTEGPQRCAKMDMNEINGRVTEKEFNEDETNSGNLAIDGKSLGLLQKSLDGTFKLGNGKAPQIKDTGAKCAKNKATAAAAYCEKDNLVSIDAKRLSTIAKPPEANFQAPDSDGKRIGDFGAFAEVSSRYTLAVLKDKKIPLDDEATGLRTACLTGSWAKFSTEPNESNLRLATGDLDEAVAELLSKQSLIAADVTGKTVPSGFARVEAFRLGFTKGAETCSKVH